MDNIDQGILKELIENIFSGDIDKIVEDIDGLLDNEEIIEMLIQFIISQEVKRFTKLNEVNGFDGENLDNARQNNYVWSMSELEDYIYVGTGRNVLLKYLPRIVPGIRLPLDWLPNEIDYNAEIWRYKKDGSLPWQRVYKADEELGIDGFRFMIKYDSFGVKPCLYAASNGESSIILKSTNGVNWFALKSETLKGNTSRAMAYHNDKLYLATVSYTGGSETYKPLLYSSTDPELYDWDPIEIGDKVGKNPQGFIYGMASFNNHIYVSTSHTEGFQVWRTEGSEPEKDKWVLILDKGAGDKANQTPLSIGTFKDYLYVGVSMDLSNIISFASPKGFDLIRVDKEDNWEIVVGGEPSIPTTPTKGERNKALSNMDSGFSNPLNVYAWQILEYEDKLLVGTLDYGTILEQAIEIWIKNKELFDKMLEDAGVEIDTSKAIEELIKGCQELKESNYPLGFDVYKSKDGAKFTPYIVGGLGNPQNYGSRILYKSDDNKLYIGTANPYEGCEVWVEKQPSLEGIFDKIKSFIEFILDLIKDIDIYEVEDEEIKEMTRYIMDESQDIDFENIDWFDPQDIKDKIKNLIELIIRLIKKIICIIKCHIHNKKCCDKCKHDCCDKCNHKPCDKCNINCDKCNHKHCDKCKHDCCDRCKCKPNHNKCNKKGNSNCANKSLTKCSDVSGNWHWSNIR